MVPVKSLLFYFYVVQLLTGEVAWSVSGYALPMSIFGCPETTVNKWRYGYMDITFKDEISLFENSLGQIWWNGIRMNPIELMGPYRSHSIQLNFCYKSEEDNDTKIEWPPGGYSFYGAGSGCPSGFNETHVNKTVTEIMHINRGGYLPDIRVNTDGNLSILSFVICQKLSAEANIPVFNMDYDFQVILLSFDETKDRLTSKSDDVIFRQTYLVSTDGTGVNTTYDWLDYYTFEPKEHINQDPGSLDHYIANATVLYAMEEVSSLGTEYSYLKNYIHEEDVWFICDIGKSTVLSGIVFWTVMDVSPQHVAIYPKVYVSDEKWRFLQNGAILCLRNITKGSTNQEKNITNWMLIKCVNSPVGRYISLVFSKLESEENRTMIEYIDFKEFITFNASPRCSRPVGMQDGALMNVQLTASSAMPEHQPYHARPQDGGWCAQTDDPQPYIQVDFLALIQVEGIQIYNLQTNDILVSADFYNISSQPSSFSILYGENVSSMNSFDHQFYLDPFLAAEDAQTVMWATSIKTRYLRIYPFRQMGPPCLKFEIIGCPPADPYGRTCATDRPVEWIDTKQLFVSAEEKDSVMSEFVNTTEECLENCEISTDVCQSVLYNKNSRTCEMIKRSASYNYILTSHGHENSGIQTFIRICDTDDNLEAETGIFNSFTELNWSDKTSSDPGILVSLGYPFYYPTEALTMWTVSVKENHFIGIQLTNVSLNKYKALDDATSNSACEDSIFLYSAIVAHTYEVMQNFDFMRTGKLNEPNKMVILLTSAQNNQQLSLQVFSNVVQIIFRTCGEIREIMERGNGFRMQIYSTGDTSWYQKGFIHSFIELEWNDITESNPATLMSHGYPLYYPAGAPTIWTISVPRNKYLNLLVSDFSLNTYKTSYSSSCEDGLYFYPSSVTYFMSQLLAYEFLVNGIIDDHGVRNIRLSSTQNHRQMSVKHRSYRMTLLLKTCDHSYEIEEHGRGFRLLAYATDMPSCVRWGYHLVREHSRCAWTTADIITSSFLGMFFKRTDNNEDSDFNFWTLYGNYHEYIYFQVTDFDVGCDTGTIFEISDGDAMIRYCNKNRPLFGIESKFYVLEIKFQSKSCGDHILVEGFKGIYRKTIKNQHMENIITSKETDAELFDKSSLKVCSTELNKCYVMLDIEDARRKDPNQTDISWDLFNSSYCRKHGWSLVNVHSRQEQEFVGYVLQHDLQYETTRQVENTEGYYGYAYLGLRRGETEFIWSDGSPITYTSWASGQPIKNINPACSRFDIRSLSASITWEAVPCDQMKAEYGVCEYAMRNRSHNITKTDFDNKTILVAPVNMTGLDMSVYFSCDNGEMISFLGRCDGKRDCISGSDEKDCNNSSSCTMDQYRCNDDHCVDISVLCDHHIDCSEGEDEECDFTECQKNEFKCISMACIDGSLQCDGKQDCPSGEDERGCSFCNPSTSLSCGDNTCVPLEYRCDGLQDCLSGKDEENCIKPDTCQEWWDAGYRGNGIYTIHGEEMECDFSEITRTKKVITKYHSIDFLDLEGKRGYNPITLSFGSTAALHTLHEHSECYQIVDQLCQPWLQELYEIDKNGTGGENKRCRCLRWKKKFGDEFGHFEDCKSGDPVSSVYSDVEFSTSHLPYVWYFTFGDNYWGTSKVPLEDIRIRLNPIVCYNDFIPKPPDIVCGNGVTVPKEFECLYDITAFGTIQGCQNLEHLQDCGARDCPDGFFKCPSSFCLKTRFVCDGIKQCEHGEDEQNCGSPDQICVSQYRCLQSNICLSVYYLCDGFRHCPLGDDERFCNFRCPYGCSCTGLTADCRTAEAYNNSKIALSVNTKFLDISTNSNFFRFLTEYNKKLFYLSFLNMSFCGVSEIPSDFFLTMRNLLILDMRYNNLVLMKSEIFVNQQKLTKLLLEGNFEIHIIESMAFKGLQSVNSLTILDAHIGSISKDAFNSLTLHTLDLSNNLIDVVDSNVFNGLSVEHLYMNATEIKQFNQDMFTGVAITNTLITDAYKFCCIRPADLSEEKCLPHKDEFSSCADLMRNDALRSLLWIIGFFSLLGNAASLLYRFIYDRERLKLGYGVFVTNLAVADFLMGIYLITIASADVAFRGIYIYNDQAWRNSAWCKMAGMLSTMSSEASVLFICLITIDRILVIKFPFGQVRFTTTSSMIASGIVWALVALIAVLPFAIKSYFNDNFYSKSGVCLALPLTRDRPPGWVYSISIFIGFNFVTFLAIAIGQWIIYKEINEAKAKMKKSSSGRASDLRVARNLLLVASTDFLCWFPIGILGILALTNHIIPGEVYAWTAVLVLPINSALNPFLYTLSAILGRGKFTPDSAEQSRIQVVSTDILDKHLDLWKNKLFVPPLYQKYLRSLPEYLNTKRLKQNTCLGIIVTVAKCVDFLHGGGLSHSNLSLENIYVNVAVKGSLSVVLSLRPRLVKNEDEKRQDIKQLGTIIANLAKKCVIRKKNVETERF